MSVVTPREPALPPQYREMQQQRGAMAQQSQLSTPWSKLTIAAATLCGDAHSVNEDSHSPVTGSAPVFVVADGVGGGALAAWASCQLVLRLHRALDRRRVDPSSVRDALLEADRDIGRGLAHRSAGPGAATVALCAATGKLLSKWLVAWVGDCRVYRTRATASGAAELLTRDDTYEHLGERPPPGGSPHDPARMVGNGAVVTPNVESVHLRDGEMLVLCSDGLSNQVSAEEIGRITRGAGRPEEICRALIEEAMHTGAPDNVTVVTARLRTPDGDYRRSTNGG